MSRALKDKIVLLAKYGSTPDTSNVVNLLNAVFFTPKPKTTEFKELGRGIGSSKTVAIEDFTTAEGSVETFLRAGLPPKIADLYKIACLEEELIKDDDGNVTEAHYKSPNNPVANGYLTLYIDGEKREITGAVGDLKITFEVGAPAKAVFDIKGFTTLSTISEANPDVTLDDSEIFIVESIDAITIGGEIKEVTNCEFSMGATINEVYAIGTKEYNLTDIKPTITITDYKQAGSFDESFNDIKAIDIKLSTASGKTFEFIANNAVMSDISESDNNENITYSKTFVLEKDSNGLNFEIVYK